MGDFWLGLLAGGVTGYLVAFTYCRFRRVFEWLEVARDDKAYEEMCREMRSEALYALRQLERLKR